MQEKVSSWVVNYKLTIEKRPASHGCHRISLDQRGTRSPQSTYHQQTKE